MITWNNCHNSSNPMHAHDEAFSIERKFGCHGDWILKYKGFTSIISWPTYKDAKAILNTRKRIPFRRSDQIEIFEVG
jgi:hypothetical protein